MVLVGWVEFCVVEECYRVVVVGGYLEFERMFVGGVCVLRCGLG